MFDPLTLFVVFLIGVWLATKLVTGGEAWIALIAAAAVFAFVLPSAGYMIAQDATMALLVLALAVGCAQWLFKATILESAAVVAVTWLAVSLLVGGF